MPRDIRYPVTAIGLRREKPYGGETAAIIDAAGRLLAVAMLYDDAVAIVAAMNQVARSVEQEAA